MPRTPAAATRVALSQRQNLITQSNSITGVGAYSVLNVTASNGTTTGPDGSTLNGNQMLASGSGIHFLDTGTVGVGSMQMFTLSFAFKPNTTPNLAVGLNNGASAFYFNSSTFVFSNIGSGILDYGYESIGNGWYRIFGTAWRVGSGITDRIYMVDNSGNISFTTAAESFFVTQIQINRGFYLGAAKFVPTTTATIDDGTPRKPLY